MVGDHELQEIINSYEATVKGVDKKAANSQNRTYGGVVRAEKRKLLEDMAKKLVKLAWKDLGKEENRLKIVWTKISIPIKEDYVEKIDLKQVREHIEKDIKNYFYPYKPDVLVSVDDEPVLEIKCKAYTENTILKEILGDCTLLKKKYPRMKFILLQLESQLGGHYSSSDFAQLGSASTHTLLSHFDFDLNIITLLKGEREADRPIHKKEFFKPLTSERLKVAIEEIKKILSKAT